ncbi:hypothetical protein ABEB36_009339 [Hypothenemus hampei]|uniref:Uncharacterized protein n=1 Tax=Hypothenemus hampei TaxID=57062 RepID=A0ABD1EG23_HYPHA
MKQVRAAKAIQAASRDMRQAVPRQHANKPDVFYKSGKKGGSLDNQQHQSLHRYRLCSKSREMGTSKGRSFGKISSKDQRFFREAREKEGVQEKEINEVNTHIAGRLAMFYKRWTNVTSHTGEFLQILGHNILYARLKIFCFQI